MCARMASARLSDECFWTWTCVAVPPRTRGDDFILDLQDGAFAMDDETLEEYQKS